MNSKLANSTGTQQKETGTKQLKVDPSNTLQQRTRLKTDLFSVTVAYFGNRTHGTDHCAQIPAAMRG